MRGLVVMAVAACGGSRAPEPPRPLANQGSAAVPEVRLPPLYANLFVPGEKKFAGELTVSVPGQLDRTPGEVTCTIFEPSTIPGGKVVELTCTGIEMVDLISGTYVGTENGLWKVDSEFDDDVRKLDPSQALFSAVPATSRSEKQDTDTGIDSGSSIVVEPHGGGWCVLVMSWGGDEGGWQLCLKEDAGIIGGHGFFAGGQTRDAYFGDVRRL